MPFRGWAALALVLLLTGCGNLPRPFSPEIKTRSTVGSLLPADGAGVVVDCPLSGDAVIAALLLRDVPATVGPGNRGSMRLTCEAGHNWLLSGADDRRLGAFIQADAEGVARNVASLLGRDAIPGPVSIRPALVVPPVAGAPGDGAMALSRAMALALLRNGATLARETDEQALLVMGSVMVTDSGPGSQYIEVIWELLSPDGSRLGVVSQENTIEAGALDGSWGPIAPLIASAGATGVIDLIERTYRAISN